MKFFCLNILLGCLLVAPFYAFSSEVAAIGESQLGVMESPIGSNWGPKVKEYLATTGIEYPAPWCAAFVQWCLAQKGQKGAGAYVPSWDKANFRVTSPARNDFGLVWFSSMNRYAHIYIVTGRPSPRSISTIEGNTNNGGSREGIGVFKRIRPLDGQRFVRWPNA